MAKFKVGDKIRIWEQMSFEGSDCSHWSHSPYTVEEIDGDAMYITGGGMGSGWVSMEGCMVHDGGMAPDDKAMIEWLHKK